MSKIIKYIIIIVNLLILTALTLSFLSVFFKFWFFQFFGLSFIVFFILNFLFFLFWLIIKKKRKYILLNLLFLLVGFSYFNDLFSVNLSNKDCEKTVRILSYNVRQFDLYNWKENKINRNKFFDFFRDKNIDIACFQEYYEDETKDFVTTDSLKLIFKTDKYYFKQVQVIKNKYKFGIATFSKFSIINNGFVNFDNTSNMIIFNDIVVNEDTIRVFNAHLQSIRFKPEDYQFVKTVEESIDSVEIKKARSLFFKLKEAFVYRAEQADSLNKYISESPYKVIVCGDFNDSPISYTYHIVKGNLKDSFKAAGKWFARSYNGDFPSFRIDYVFVDKNIVVCDYDCPKINLSDHFPVLVDVKF